MITITFAGDESGDVSFNFGKGATRYFVMAVIATTEPENLRHALADAIKEFGLPASYEFSFNSIASAPLRKHVFQALQNADFEAWALVVDKTRLSIPFTIMRRLDFYLFCITELLQSIPAEQREKATLILSEPLIQVADLVAGAVLRRDAQHDSESFDIIERKFNKVVEYNG